MTTAVMMIVRAEWLKEWRGWGLGSLGVGVFGFRLGVSCLPHPAKTLPQQRHVITDPREDLESRTPDLIWELILLKSDL